MGEVIMRHRWELQRVRYLMRYLKAFHWAGFSPDFPTLEWIPMIIPYEVMKFYGIALDGAQTKGGDDAGL